MMVSSEQESGNTTPADFYRKKTLRVRFHKSDLHFEIPQSGFSSYQLDQGTAHLLREIDVAAPRWNRVLDLGCGYGPIAIHLASAGITQSVAGIDRDMLAVEYARRNAAANSLPQCTFNGGLAYENVPDGPYSAIVSNIPAKAGEDVHRLMLLDASSRLEPSGRVWIVVVRSLEPLVDAILAHDDIVITHKRRFARHLVYSYRFNRPVTADGPAYAGRRQVFTWKGKDYALDVFDDLPESDELAEETLQLLHYLAEKERPELRRIVLADPGQGHLALLLPPILASVSEVALVSRDALALKASAHNMHASVPQIALTALHSITYWENSVGTNVDAFAAVLNPKEGIEIGSAKIAAALRALPTAVFFAASSVSYRTRYLKALRALGVKAKAVRERNHACVLECTIASGKS